MKNIKIAYLYELIILSAFCLAHFNFNIIFTAFSEEVSRHFQMEAVVADWLHHHAEEYVQHEAEATNVSDYFKDGIELY